MKKLKKYIKDRINSFKNVKKINPINEKLSIQDFKDSLSYNNFILGKLNFFDSILFKILLTTKKSYIKIYLTKYFHYSKKVETINEMQFYYVRQIVSNIEYNLLQDRNTEKTTEELHKYFNLLRDVWNDGYQYSKEYGGSIHFYSIISYVKIYGKIYDVQKGIEVNDSSFKKEFINQQIDNLYNILFNNISKLEEKREDIITHDLLLNNGFTLDKYNYFNNDMGVQIRYKKNEYILYIPDTIGNVVNLKKCVNYYHEVLEHIEKYKEFYNNSIERPHVDSSHLND